jgi:hypothetical protein
LDSPSNVSVSEYRQFIAAPAWRGGIRLCRGATSHGLEQCHRSGIHVRCQYDCEDPAVGNRRC